MYYFFSSLCVLRASVSEWVCERVNGRMTSIHSRALPCDTTRRWVASTALAKLKTANFGRSITCSGHRTSLWRSGGNTEAPQRSQKIDNSVGRFWTSILLSCWWVVLMPQGAEQIFTVKPKLMYKKCMFTIPFYNKLISVSLVWFGICSLSLTEEF